MMRKKYRSMLLGATFSSVSNSLLLITDSLISGIFLGHRAVSAVNLVAPVFNLGFFLAMLISVGIPIMYSNEMGNFHKKEADRIFGTGLTTALAAGILIFFLLTFFRDLYFRFYQLPTELISLSADYYYWVRFALLATPLAEVVVEMVFADGDEACTLFVTIVEAVSNIVLSIILCRKMGIAGIGLGTAIAVILHVLLSFSHLLKKGNSLRPNLFFSFSILCDTVSYSLADAGCYLFLAVFSCILNKFVLWRFGDQMLIMVSVILLVQQFQMIFDGIGEAITPIISVYLSEDCFPGVRKIWRLAVTTAMIEGTGMALLLAALSPVLPGVLGITDPGLHHTASTGIILMAPGMPFVCLLYLLPAYYLLLDRISLSFWVSAMRDVAVLLPSLLLLGMIFGIYGVFAGFAVGPMLALLVALIYIARRYGRENVPLLIAEREQAVKSYLFELRVFPEEIMKVRDAFAAVLSENGVPEKAVVRSTLVFEELFMMVYENNPAGNVQGEAALTISQEKLSIIMRDNGVPLNLMDQNLEVSSIRCYIVPGLLSHWCHNEKHLMTMSFNRNMLELEL
ncbi:MAG: hypothetical protein K6G83_03695 [Lachnospiraceae bacterium]|nr:hypothetical protein [Lachnospiraceae bacterium]